MKKQAVILAGGKGTRLKPYNTVLPKPLMPMDTCPILEVVVRQLKICGFQEIIITVGHLGGLIEAFFGSGEKWGIEIRYSLEESPLGTSGPLAMIEGLGENFLVMNGDILTDLDYSAFMKFHLDNGCAATIGSSRKAVPVSLGVIEADGTGQVTDYIEKPTLHYQVSMGVYAFNRRVLRFVEKGRYLDFPDLVKRLIKEGESVRIFKFDGVWFDIGRVEDYEEAVEFFTTHKSSFKAGL